MNNTRSRVHELFKESYARGDYTGWFETLYAEAKGDYSLIPWADRIVNPALLDLKWNETSKYTWQNMHVLVVGCGLGDNAEYLAKLGANITAFDLSKTAIDWCNHRFPSTTVDYQVVDLFDAPSEWKLKFDLVIEIYTIQALPVNIHPTAVDRIANFVKPSGWLLVICHGRNPEDNCDNLPFPITQDELNRFNNNGLSQISFNDSIDTWGSKSLRQFRILYERHDPNIVHPYLRR